MGLSEFFSSFIPTVYAEEEEVAEVVEEVVEEEEEEEEEPEDPKEQIMEECTNNVPALSTTSTNVMNALKMALLKTVRIEEFFHFMHCADECAAPKIFAATQ
ncbi:unnamed protein product [Cunninghamella echinulata]